MKRLQYISRSLRFGPKEKVNYDFFSVKFSVKIYRYVPYRYRVVFDSVSFSDDENPNSLSWGSFSWETCFCNQQMFSIRCIWKMSKDDRKPLKISSSTRIVMYTNFLFFSYFLQSYYSKWATSATEMQCPI